MAALERFGPLYEAALARRWCWRLGVESQGTAADLALVAAAERHMAAAGLAPDALFFRHRAGRAAPDDDFGALLRTYAPAAPTDDPLWQEPAPPTNHIDEVERIWAAIAEGDDWQPLTGHVATIRRLGSALGPAPEPAGHGS